MGETNGNKTKSVHPPLTDIKIETSQRKIIATPFKTRANLNNNETATKAEIKEIYQQNNYHSQILHTVAKQIDHIDNKIEVKEPQNLFSSTSKPFITIPKTDIKFQNNEVLKSIANRLDDLDKGKRINIIEEEEESNQDSESDIQEINKIRNNFRSKKPYYKNILHLIYYLKKINIKPVIIPATV